MCHTLLLSCWTLDSAYECSTDGVIVISHLSLVLDGILIESAAATATARADSPSSLISTGLLTGNMPGPLGCHLMLVTEGYVAHLKERLKDMAAHVTALQGEAQYQVCAFNTQRLFLND